MEPEHVIVDGEKIYSNKYYAVAEVPNKDQKGSHWHVLLNAEQHQTRILNSESCITLSLANEKYKYTKQETGDEFDKPLHVFGRGTHDPDILAAKLLAIEEEK
jgi:hypothetical protein